MSFFSPEDDSANLSDECVRHNKVMEECAPFIGRVQFPWSAIAEAQQKLELRPSRLPAIADLRLVGGRTGEAYGGSSLAPAHNSCPAFKDAYNGFCALQRPLYVDVRRSDVCHAAVCASIKETEEASQLSVQHLHEGTGTANPRRCAVWVLIPNSVEDSGSATSSSTMTTGMAAKRAAALGDAIAHVATRSDPPSTRETAFYVCSPSSVSAEIILGEWEPTHCKLSGKRTWGRAQWHQAQMNGSALMIVGWYETGTLMRFARIELIQTGCGISSTNAIVNAISRMFVQILHEGAPLSPLLVADSMGRSPVQDEWGLCTERVDKLFVGKLRNPDSVTLSEELKQDTEPLEFTCIYLRLCPRGQPTDAVTAFPGLLLCKRDHINAVAKLVSLSIAEQSGELRKPRGVVEEMHGMHCSALHYAPVALGADVSFFAPRCLMSLKRAPGEPIFPYDPHTNLFVRSSAVRPIDEVIDQFYIMPCDGTSLYAGQTQLEIHSRDVLQTLVNFTNCAVEQANLSKHNYEGAGRSDIKSRNAPRLPTGPASACVSPENNNEAHLYMAVRGMCSFRNLTIGNCYNDVCTYDSRNKALQQFLLTALVRLGASATVGSAMQAATEALAAQATGLVTPSGKKIADVNSIECTRLKAVADAALTISSSEKRRRLADKTGCAFREPLAVPVETQRMRNAISAVGMRLHDATVPAEVRLAPPMEAVARFVFDQLGDASKHQDKRVNDEAQNLTISHAAEAFHGPIKSTINDRLEQLAVCCCRIRRMDQGCAVFLVETTTNGAMIRSIMRLTPQSVWEACTEGDLFSAYIQFDAGDAAAKSAHPRAFVIEDGVEQPMLRIM
jgi:hypothetical protein